MPRISRNNPLKTNTSASHTSRPVGSVSGRTAQVKTGTGNRLKAAFALFGALAAGAVAYAYSRSYNAPSSQKANLLATYMHSGLQLPGDGSAGCILRRHADSGRPLLISAEQCAHDVGVMIEAIRSANMQDGFFTDSAFQNRGSVAIDRRTGYTYAVGINPQKKSDYMQATILADEKIVQTPGFFKQPTSDIIEFFKTLHRTMMRSAPQANPGEFRTAGAMVFHRDTNDKDPSARLKQLEDAGATPEEVNIAANALKVRADVSDFTAQERAIWSKVATFTTHPSEIEAGLHRFIDEMRSLSADDTDTTTMAAKAHMDLVRIHPWQDGNGRFARLLMNTILPEPVIFLEQESYMAAVLKDCQHPGHFEKFISHAK